MPLRTPPLSFPVCSRPRGAHRCPGASQPPRQRRPWQPCRKAGPRSVFRFPGGRAAGGPRACRAPRHGGRQKPASPARRLREARRSRRSPLPPSAPRHAYPPPFRSGRRRHPPPPRPPNTGPSLATLSRAAAALGPSARCRAAGRSLRSTASRRRAPPPPRKAGRSAAAQGTRGAPRRFARTHERSRLGGVQFPAGRGGRPLHRPAKRSRPALLHCQSYPDAHSRRATVRDKGAPRHRMVARVTASGCGGIRSRKTALHPGPMPPPQQHDAADYDGIPAHVPMCPCNRNPIDTARVLRCPTCQARLCAVCALHSEQPQHECRLAREPRYPRRTTALL